MHLFPHLRVTFTSILIALAIVACGGGSSDSGASAEIMNDSQVEIEPISNEVLGDDIDADGIRDDFQLHIENTYAGKLEIMRRTKDKARLEQKVVSNLHDISELRKILPEYVKANICWSRAFPTYGKEREIAAADFRYYFYNDDRILIHDLVNQQMAEAFADFSMTPLAEDACN